MAVPLSQLQDVIKKATLAVTNASEELFQKGLLTRAIDQGIQFSIQVYDDTQEMPAMQVNEEDSPEMVSERSASETPPSTQQSQSYGRSSESNVTYTG